MIIFINGTVNSGKSTISENLAKRLEQTAHIEVDLLRKFIKHIHGPQAWPISIENTDQSIEEILMHISNKDILDLKLL